MKSSLRSFTTTLIALLLTQTFAQAAFAQTGVATSEDSRKTIADEKYEEKSLLKRHKPFYFAYGEPDSKVQLSFSLSLFNKFPLYFGYTQLMFWSLKQHSKPFRDMTYNPELYYRVSTPNWGLIKSLDVGLHGHNSNGKGGTVSRSLDYNYLRLNMEKKGERWITRANVQVQALHSFDHGNRDIQEYIGPLVFNLTFVQLFDAWFDKSEFGIQAIPGGKWCDAWDRGGYQLSWSFRLGAINMTPAFYLQYYHGYAETLLNYNKQVDEVRAGVIF